VKLSALDCKALQRKALSRGALALAAWLEKQGHGSAAALARDLGCSGEMIHFLKTGRKKPGRVLAAKLQIRLGLDPLSWD
jgi:hypothetical protein